MAFAKRRPCSAQSQAPKVLTTNPKNKNNAHGSRSVGFFTTNQRSTTKQQREQCVTSQSKKQTSPATTTTQQPTQHRNNLLRLAHPPITNRPARLPSLPGPNKRVPITTQRLNIPLRRRLSPHHFIHRRRKQHRRLRTINRAQKQTHNIVSPPGRQPRNRIHRARRNQRSINTPRQRDMLRILRFDVLPGVRVHRPPAQRLERQRRNKPSRRPSHRNSHRSPSLRQPTHNRRRLVRRDPAANTNQQTLPAEHA